MQKDIHTLVRDGANTMGYIVRPILEERETASRIHIRINGKRCIARTATNVIKPEGNAFGYVRFGASGVESDSAIKAIILIVAPPDESPVYYIMSPLEWKTLLREQGRSTRSGTGSAPALSVSHPPQLNARVEPYRNNWALFA